MIAPNTGTDFCTGVLHRNSDDAAYYGRFMHKEAIH